MEKNRLEMSVLFDFYGGLLTEKQRIYFDLYYNQDLSLSEIAENDGITRQAVRDIIARGEHTMTNAEQKTGLMDRFSDLQKNISNIEALAIDILLLNQTRLKSEKLQKLTNHIMDRLTQMKG